MLFFELYAVTANKVNAYVLGVGDLPLDSPLFSPSADANGFVAPQVQSCLLECSVKAHP